MPFEKMKWREMWSGTSFSGWGEGGKGKEERKEKKEKKERKIIVAGHGGTVL